MYFLKISLEKKAEEVDSLTSRIQELEAQLSVEKEECKRWLLILYYHSSPIFIYLYFISLLLDGRHSFSFTYLLFTIDHSGSLQTSRSLWKHISIMCRLKMNLKGIFLDTISHDLSVFFVCLTHFVFLWWLVVFISWLIHGTV